MRSVREVRLEKLASIVITNSLQCQSNGSSFHLRTKGVLAVLQTEKVTGVKGILKMITNAWHL